MRVRVVIKSVYAQTEIYLHNKNTYNTFFIFLDLIEMEEKVVQVIRPIRSLCRPSNTFNDKTT